MQAIQQGNLVPAALGSAQGTILQRQSRVFSIALSIVGAFFIVLGVSFFLSQALGYLSTSRTFSFKVGEERTAFQPSSQVSSQFSRGYYLLQ